MKNITIITAFLLQILVSEYAVRQLLFLDATPTFLERLVYHLVTVPPFIMGLILISETRNLGKTFAYASIFYVIAIITLQAFLKIPNSIQHKNGITESIGSYGFFQTGGGFGALSLIPQILVTGVSIFLLKKQIK